MWTSSKPKSSDMEDVDTRQVVVVKKRRDTSASTPPPSPKPPPPPPSSSSAAAAAAAVTAYHDEYESPPAAQTVPWDMYDDDDDYDDDNDNDDFEFSPASPPLTQSTERQETSSPPTVYILPNASVVLSEDDPTYIPNRPPNPEPSTSYSTEMSLQVCDILIEEGVGNLIVHRLHRSQLSLYEDDVPRHYGNDAVTRMAKRTERQYEGNQFGAAEISIDYNAYNRVDEHYNHCRIVV